MLVLVIFFVFHNLNYGYNTICFLCQNQYIFQANTR